MASIAGDSYVLVLYDILFDDSHSCLFSSSLCVCKNISVCGWDEAVVAWNVLGHLSGTNSQLILLVALRLRVKWQDGSWFVSVLAKSI